MNEPPISSDPRAVEILAKVLYHSPADLDLVVAHLLTRMPARQAVQWLTHSHERLGWKWPLWCTREQVEEVLAGVRVLG